MTLGVGSRRASAKAGTLGRLTGVLTQAFCVPRQLARVGAVFSVTTDGLLYPVQALEALMFKSARATLLRF
jgi:hypothetical protein